MNIREELFTCKRGELTIKGMQYLPNNFQVDKKYPAIIVSHGFTGNYLSTRDYCLEFAQMNYVAYSFNFCGGGRLIENESLKSDGATTDMTIESEVEDLIAVKNYVKQFNYIDTEEIILAGISQGGLVSGLTAARCSSEIKKLIMICPALCIPDHARRGCLGGAQYDPANVPELIDCGKTILGRKFHDGVVNMDPFLEISRYHGPVLILHGLEDKTVNYSYAVRAKESYAPGQAQLNLIRNADHGFNEKQVAGILASIRQFLLNRKEILTIRIIITHKEESVTGNIRRVNIYFVGCCETPYFQGSMESQGCDAQEYVDGHQTKIRAEYTLTGLDARGDKCFIHIVNKRGENDWKPVIQTNSHELSWLNKADLTAVLESGNGGPTVRVYALNNDISI